MPWTGLTKPEGTDRLVCDDDLDGGGGDPEIGSFMASVDVAPGPGIPIITIGTRDMSMEFLILPRTGDLSELSTEIGPASGVGDDVIADGTTIGITPIFGDNNFLVAQWRGTLGGVGVTLSSFNPRVAWTHLAINYDRSGNMEFFDNGVSVGVDDISADEGLSIQSESIYPASIISATSSSDAAWFTPMAGFAIHSRLLTAPEIATNVAALNVGSYAETEVRYKFGSFVDSAGDPLVPVKETDLDNIGGAISSALRWTQPTAYLDTLYAPEGVDGTVLIEDLSGNGRHFSPFTRASYGPAEADRAQCAFSTLGAS